MKLSHEPWLPFAKTLGTLSPFWKSLRSPVSQSGFGNVASSVFLPIFIFEGLVCTIDHDYVFSLQSTAGLCVVTRIVCYSCRLMKS